MQEKISALLDDELNRSEQDEVLRAISSESRLSQTWQRYHLIRAVLRTESIVHVYHLPERIAPLLSGKTGQTRRQPPATPNWMPGLALAASIAGLVGFGLFSTLSEPESVQSAQPNQVVQADQGTQWETSTPDVEQTLNAFLVEHGEFTPLPSMNGLMAYAKFVSYDSTD
jgi:anti-sigma factor RsiW